MRILGLSFDYHDAAAALLVDGNIVAAAQEERFSRKKNDASFPSAAVSFCLERAGLVADELDAVVYYEDAFLKFDRIRSLASNGGQRGANYLRETLADWIRARKFEPEKRICEHLGVSPSRVHHVTHHESHAASAFFCSPFDEATVVTIDGVGEYETISVSVGRGCSIEKRAALRMPHSIGLFYSAFTAFLGFEVNEGEYKVMGMAGFGRATRVESVRSMVEFAVDGFVQLRDEFFNFACPADVPFTPALSSVLGKPRSAESPFKLPIDRDGPMDDVERESLNYADIAASVQVVVEDMILHVVRGAISRTGLTNVCLAGGVALNSLANARIKREITEQLYIQPAAGDAGAALGAALAWHHRNPKAPRLPPLHSAFLGREYAIEEIRAALNESGPYVVERIDNPSEYAKRVAEALEHGEVIGWVQGRFEWGPRSLGARSILADPRDTQMQSRVNEKIKFREPFRPFAPIVLAERADEFFELPTSRTPSSPESFMLSVWPVRQPARDRIPAVTHVDGTARVQLVRREDSPLLHSLLSAFADSTGIPVLLNTSFNRRGEPIVASPADAVKTFDWTGLDVLAIGPFLVRKTTELP